MLTSSQKKLLDRLRETRRQVFGHVRVSASGKRSLVRPHFRTIAALRALLRK